MQSSCWSFWRWIIWYGSPQGLKTKLQPAGKETGLHRFPFQHRDSCTSCMSWTLSCLDTPNLTACFTSRPYQAKGSDSALCVAPSPSLPAHNEHMPLKNSLWSCVFNLFYAYLKRQKCLSALFYFWHYIISKVHQLTSYFIPVCVSSCNGTLKSIFWMRYFGKSWVKVLGCMLAHISEGEVCRKIKSF